MRRVLVDEARRSRVAVRVQEQVAKESTSTCEFPLDVFALNEALSRLSGMNARQAQIVELRYFGGLTIEETAELLGISPKTVKRDWEMARVWLHAELRPKTK